MQGQLISTEHLANRRAGAPRQAATGR